MRSSCLGDLLRLLFPDGPCQGLLAHGWPGDGPVVVLFAEDRADEADDGFAVGEDADDVGAAAEFLVEALLGVVGPDLAPVLLGECGEGQDVGPGCLDQGGGLGEALELGDDPGVLGPDVLGRRLGKDGPHGGRDRGLGAPENPGQEVAGEMGAAPPPGGPGRTAATAALRPSWASAATRCTPTARRPPGPVGRPPRPPRPRR